MEFVSWDDDSIPNLMEKHNPVMFQSPPTRIYLSVLHPYIRSPQFGDLLWPSHGKLSWRPRPLLPFAALVHGSHQGSIALGRGCHGQVCLAETNEGSGASSTTGAKFGIS